jgi:hypothetical protein
VSTIFFEVLFLENINTLIDMQIIVWADLQRSFTAISTGLISYKTAENAAAEFNNLINLFTSSPGPRMTSFSQLSFVWGYNSNRRYIQFDEFFPNEFNDISHFTKISCTFLRGVNWIDIDLKYLDDVTYAELKVKIKNCLFQ